MVTELVCGTETFGVATVVNSESEEEELLKTHEIGVAVSYVDPATSTSSSERPIVTTTSTSTTTTTTTSTTTTPRSTTVYTTTQRPSTYRIMTTLSTTSTTTTTPPPPPVSTTTRGNMHPATRRNNIVLPRTTAHPWPQQRPPLSMGYPAARPVQEVLVRSAHRQDNSVIIQWDSETANILGFRVVYRLFGDKSFKQGPPLEASEREFKIKNVPSQVIIAHKLIIILR